MSIVNKVFKSAGNFLIKNDTYIFTILGVAGTITTAILAVEATPKAIRLIEEAECKEPLEKIKVAWKCYIPAGISAGITIGCIIGLNSAHTRKNAALAGLYSLAQTTFKEYQEKVVETIGENKERKVRDEVDKDRILSNPPATDVIFSGTGDVLCYDSITGRYFNSEIEKVRRIINELNRELMTEMFIPLNEFYIDLGLKPTKIGDDIGFNIDNGLLQVDFSSQLTEEGRPCLVLNYNVYSRFE